MWFMFPWSLNHDVSEDEVHVFKINEGCPCSGCVWAFASSGDGFYIKNLFSLKNIIYTRVVFFYQKLHGLASFFNRDMLIC